MQHETEQREIPIRGETIRLGQLLKLAGIVDAGGELKDFLEHELVLVNGEADRRRGRQLHPGDRVEVAGLTLRVAAG
ncbi:MAG TPA: RNA-binding S4 domain-containing protein [Solirubrobacteraceae bacterium]|nr:RNA-binding S4 domain-containing protein [Solirubrobacteraceae bacterium]